MDKSGYYRRLYHMQFNRHQDEEAPAFKVAAISWTFTLRGSEPRREKSFS